MTRNLYLLIMNSELVVASDKTDIAILRPLEALPSSLVPAKLARSSNVLLPTDAVIIVAAPSILPPFVTTGTVITPRAVWKEDGLSRIIITAHAASGSSGGGLFREGKLIGVVVQTFREAAPIPRIGTFAAQNIFFIAIAMPILYVHELLQEIEYE